ncbi:hypothetical protein FDA48_03945 [Clostridium botulinum]|nr:hypothetical protein [Clostridium botulinum]
MAKSNSLVHINRMFNPKCNNGAEICPLIKELEGHNNRRLSFIFQIFYSLIALFVVGNNIKDGKEYFISLLLFCAPLFLEYLSYKSKNFFNNSIYYIQKVIFGIGTLIGGLGALTNTFSIKIIDDVKYILVSKECFAFCGSQFRITYIMFPLIVGILLIFTSIFSLSSRFEEIVNNSMKLSNENTF